MLKKEISILITDLDNTLWDWFAIWYSTFKPMFDALIRETQLPAETLTREMKAVFTRHKTSEYAFVMQELPCLQHLYGPDFDPGKDLAAVIEAAKEGRRQAMQLYPGVLETLVYLEQKGCLIVGFTESQTFYTKQRIKKLGLDGVIDILYAGGDHEITSAIDLSKVRRKQAEDYELRYTEVRPLAFGLKKPDKKVLENILAGLETVEPYTDVIYIGDNIMKDIAMANAVPVTAVHAAYGVNHNDPRYNLLRAVTHWPDSDVANETSAKATPDVVLNHNFAEILDHFTPKKK